jgi:hypothetical protein
MAFRPSTVIPVGSFDRTVPTVMVAVAETPSLVAVMIDVPTETPVSAPVVVLTVMTDVFEEE